MAHDGFQVTPEALQIAATSCDNTAAQVNEQLTSLQTYVRGLEGAWQGIAQDTFQQLMIDYSTYSRMMNDALTDIASGLRGNQVNYQDTERQNLNSLQSIQDNLMPGQAGFELPPARF